MFVIPSKNRHVSGLKEGRWTGRSSSGDTIRRSGRSLLLIVILTAIIALISGCKSSQYAEWADRAAYSAVSEAQGAALGEAYQFDITYNPVDCNHYLRQAEGIDGNDVHVLTVEDALKVAFHNSRSFQTRKEALYSSALFLANVSRGWEGLLPSGGVDAVGEMTRTSRGGPEGGPDNTNRYISADGNYSLAKRLVGGGMLTLGASLDYVTNFLGLSDTMAGSLVQATFTQPLLRGAWKDLAFEDQHRLERDFLIEVYEFDRFRQTFAVNIMQQYYRVLTLRDTLENSRTNIKRLTTAYLTTKALVEGGQLRRTQADQAEQNLLGSQISFEQTQLAYSQALDNFKIALGLPISRELNLDYPGALKRLNENGPQPLPFAESSAIDTSFVTDTTLLRARAGARDAEKDVEIAENDFLPQLDLELAASAPGTDNAQPARIQTHRHTRSARLVFNYNLDQTDNRDAYRNAMISRNRAKRNLAEVEDTTTLDVLNSFRSLKQSKESYVLQAKSVAIAKRRTTLVGIERQQGEASTRDVLEAEDALNSSLNGLTSSLVNYTITRLEFLASLGMLEVAADEVLIEREIPFGYDRLQERYRYLNSREPDENQATTAASRESGEAETTEEMQGPFAEKAH